MDGTAFGYHDGIVQVAPDVVQVERVYQGQCPTCNEFREDLSMPCERCGEVE